MSQALRFGLNAEGPSNGQVQYMSVVEFDLLQGRVSCVLNT